MNSGPKWSLRNGAQYRRLCARPGCGAAAVATLRFQSTQRQAWLVELDVNAARTQGDLCQRHAAALVLPRGWELHDERAPGTWSPVVSSSAKPAKGAAGARKTRARRKKVAADDVAADAALPGFEPVAPVAAPPAETVVVTEVAVTEVVVTEVEVTEVEVTEVAVVEAVVPEPVAPEAPAPVAEPAPVEATEPQGLGHAARPVPAQFGASDEEDVEEELGEILDARTPLLQRAFRNAKPLTGEEESGGAADSDDD